MTYQNISYLIIRLGNGIFSFVTLIIFTKLLSPSEYGIYALGMAISSIASTVLFQWLNLSVGHFYPTHPNDSGKIMIIAARGYWTAVMVAAILYLGTLFFQEFLNLNPYFISIVFLITITLGLHSLTLQEKNSQNDPISYGIVSWIKSGGAFIWGSIFIFFGAGERGALLGFFVGILLSIIFFTPKGILDLKSYSKNKKLSIEMFQYGLPLSLNFFAIALVDLSDRFMIGYLLGIEYVATYSVAYDMTQLIIGSSMNFLYLAAFPRIIKTYLESSLNERREILTPLGSKIILIGLPVAFVLGALANDIYEIFFWKDLYRNGAELIPLLAGAIFLGTFKICCLDLALQLLNKNKYLSYISILMALINISLNFFFIPIYGVFASAWIMIITFTIGVFISYYLCKNYFSFLKILKIFKVGFISSLIMGVSLYFLPSTNEIIWLIIKILLGLLIYLILLIINKKLICIF